MIHIMRIIKIFFFILFLHFPPTVAMMTKNLSSPRAANLPNVFHSLLSSFFFIFVVCCPFPSSEKLKNSFIVLRSLCLSSLHSIFLISLLLVPFLPGFPREYSK